MIDLTSLSLRLENQFLDPYGLALPGNLLTEAFRASLAEMNSILGTNLVLSGLDDALLSTLLEHHLPALLRGAAATILEALAFHNSANYSNIPSNQPDLETWSGSLRQERDQLLDRLRLSTFTQSTSVPWGSWELVDSEFDD